MVKTLNGVNMKTSTLISSYFMCLCVFTLTHHRCNAENPKAGYQNLDRLQRSKQIRLSSSHELHHRQKRGFRSGVADRIAHGFGKRTMSVYTGVNRLADLLTTGYREEDIPVTKIGMPVIQLAKQFHDDQNTLVDYLSSFIDRNGDGFLEPSELFGDQYVPDI